MQQATVDGLERLLQHARLPASTYYRLSHRMHRASWRCDIGRVAPGIDPLAVHWIPTDSIVRLRGGPRGPRHHYPSGLGPLRDLGAVRDGDWDVDPPSYDPAYPLADLIASERFEDTVHFRSMRAHFLDGTPWDATTFVREVTRRSRSGSFPWNAYRDPPTIARTCRRLDRLYRDIFRHGIRPQRHVDVAAGRRRPFLQTVRNEILVDLGRTGEPLFVDGRHRLAIAKLLRLPLVPVVIVVRHVDWTRGTLETTAAPKLSSDEPAWNPRP